MKVVTRKIVGVVLLFIGSVSSTPVPNRSNSVTTPNSFNVNSNTVGQDYYQTQQQQWQPAYHNGGGYTTPNYRGVKQQPQQNYQNQYQNQAYYAAENHQNPVQANYDQEDNDSGFHLPQMPMVVIEPMRRMYHVYEDNVRGFAKRFRNAVYAPMRMMG